VTARDARRAPGKARPGIEDVARLAGVSGQTVSRYVNGHPYVSDALAQRIEDAIRTLGYRPNDAARALRIGRSATIGVVSLETALYGPTSALLAVEQAARRAHFSVSIVTVPSVDGRLLIEAVERLERQSVAGILVTAASSTATPAALRDASFGVPVVLTERVSGCDFPSVGLDSGGAARTATAYLLELGHRKVWHVSGPPLWQAAHDRKAAWRAVLSSAGATGRSIAGDWSAASGYAAGLRIADSGGVTAVFAANDQMAFGVMSALADRGIKVPDDISVVGLDDIPEAAYFRPSLTTVQQDFRRLGEHGLQYLLSHVEASPEPEPPLIPTSLVIRQSAAPAVDRI
jgi:DNA-binding LacI/PurR family transcriptional regulator